MARVQDSGQAPPLRPRGSIGPRSELQSKLAPDSLHLSGDASILDWFWKALERLRLAIAGIEARFGLLPELRAQPGPIPEAPRLEDGFRLVESAPRPAAHNEDRSMVAALRQQIRDRRVAEARALQGLGRADREAYKTVREVVEADVEAHAAMQNLLLRPDFGKVPSVAGRSAWQHLAELATQEPGPQIDRRTLVGHVLEELDDPARIFQGDRYACVPAVMAIMLARERPAELVRLVAGLAGQDGHVSMANGHTVRRVPDWRTPDGGRSISQALLQAGLMAYAGELSGLSFHNARDRFSNGGQGLNVLEANGLYEALTARAAIPSHFYRGRNPEQVALAFTQIEEAVRRGLTVPVGVDWLNGDRHKILVDRVENGRVWFTNPYGTRESWPIEELAKRISNLNLPL